MTPPPTKSQKVCLETKGAGADHQQPTYFLMNCIKFDFNSKYKSTIKLGPQKKIKFREELTHQATKAHYVIKQQ